jgi:dihydrofolate reductase
MGRIIVSEFVSLDGVFEDPGGAEGSRHGGWTFKFRDEGQMKYKLEETLEAEALLLGRVTYDGFAEAWPTLADPVGFADKMNGMPKFVVSSTLTDPAWNNSTVLGGELAVEVEALRNRTAGDLVVAGSGTLVRALLDHGLVDELRLIVFPVILGSGRRLFEAGDEPITLKLASSQALGSGSMILTYHPA